MPRAGLEPARLAAQDPKSCVAASYTTSAAEPTAGAPGEVAHGRLSVGDITSIVRANTRARHFSFPFPGQISYRLHLPASETGHARRSHTGPSDTHRRRATWYKTLNRY